MNIHDAQPGTVIKERQVDSIARTVVSWENDGFGNTVVITKNDKGRTSKIKAKNINRYEVVREA